MRSTVNKSLYKAFGLHFLSEISLPELSQDTLTEEGEYITIKIGELSELWSNLSKSNKYFYVRPELCMFIVPGIAIYKVDNGNHITISPLKGSQEDQIRLYLLGTCMGALLMQRKTLPLHGSALAIEGKAYAIVGDSGAGKSTLASAFLQKGYFLLSDDIIPVNLSKRGNPYVTAAYPQQKLWQESLEEFGLETSQFRSIINRETKFVVPVAEQFVQESMPLAGIIELTKNDHSEIEFQFTHTLQRLRILFAHTYRNFLINNAGLMQWHFDITANIANKVDLFRLKRPTTRFTAQELTEVILTAINKEEKVHD